MKRRKADDVRLRSTGCSIRDMREYTVGTPIREKEVTGVPVGGLFITPWNGHGKRRRGLSFEQLCMRLFVELPLACRIVELGLQTSVKQHSSLAVSARYYLCSCCCNVIV